MPENSENKPLVTVIVPVYNAGKFIRDTVNSVLDQSFDNWELLLINDGSKDDSLKILHEFQNRFPDKIKVIDKMNSGVSETRNLGISLAKGDYIAFLDADDFWLNENLKMKIGLLESDSSIDYVFSDMYNTDENLKNPELAPEGKDENILIDLLSWNGEVIPGPSSNLVVRKTCFAKGIRFKKELSTIADQNFTVQLAFHFKGKRIPVPLWYYRIVKGSMSKSVRLMEKDCLTTYWDYSENGYFFSKRFTLYCYSNMFLIVAGSFWKDADKKWLASDYLLKSFFCNPTMIYKLMKKLRRIN